MKRYINPKYKERVSEFISSLPDRFEREGEMLYNKRNVVKRFQVDGLTLVVKRYKVPLWFQRIDYTWFRPSKGLRAYRFALKLRLLGIDTPEAVACVEVTRNGIFRQGYFVSTECKDENLKCLIEDEKTPEELFEAYVRFLIEMHDKGFLHGDLNLSNILYRKNQNGLYHFTVIDTNRSHFVEKPSREQCLKNLMRINRNRSFSRRVVSRYAELRGWNVEESVQIVSHEIDRYERKRKMRKLSKKVVRKG